MRRIYDYECPKCELVFEWFAEFDEVVKCPLCWDEDSKRIMPQGKAPGFKLKYNNKTDMCDWDGNTSQYWNKYKSLSPSERKKVVMPEDDKKTKEIKEKILE